MKTFIHAFITGMYYLHILNIPVLLLGYLFHRKFHHRKDYLLLLIVEILAFLVCDIFWDLLQGFDRYGPYLVSWFVGLLLLAQGAAAIVEFIRKENGKEK